MTFFQIIPNKNRAGVRLEKRKELLKTVEELILQQLIYNTDFSAKVFPYLKAEYFSDPVEQKVFEKISDYILTYQSLPSLEALIIQLGSDGTLNDERRQLAVEQVEALQLDSDSHTDLVWLLSETEKWCKDRAYENTIRTAASLIHELDQKKQKVSLSRTDIPNLLNDANAISFDPNVGHDYLDDAETRFDLYHVKEQKVPTDIEKINQITNGGWDVGTLNVFMAGPGGGKSLVMCHMAAAAFAAGKNVLYITLEMSETHIAHRIDANLMNLALKDVKDLPRETYVKRADTIRKKSPGKLVIKQYPTSLGSCTHFRHLLTELRLKKKFIPDILFIDYLNIAASSKFNRQYSNSYEYIKGIAEEMRGMAMEFKFPIVTATQINREGFKSTDVDLGHASESFGLPATADFFAAIISDDTLERMGQIKIKPLKNRYGDVSKSSRVFVGIDKTKMRLFDLDENAYKKSEALDGDVVEGMTRTRKTTGVKVERRTDEDANIFGQKKTNFKRGKSRYQDIKL